MLGYLKKSGLQDISRAVAGFAAQQWLHSSAHISRRFLLPGQAIALK